MSSFLNFPFQSQMIKVAWITLFWTLFSVFQFFIGYQTLLALQCDLAGVNPMVFFWGSIFTGILAGLTGGSLIVFLWEKWLRTKSYRWTLTNIFFSFTAIYLFVSISSGLFFQVNKNSTSLFDPLVWQLELEHLLSFGELQSYLIWLFIVVATMIFLQINDKYGPGTFLTFLKGKYFHPHREERIFMFLDLRSSTTIAERLQEERYFHFIKDVIQHATPPILKNRGEIYQYVGDEIVISWPLSQSKQSENCLHCFFEIQQELLKRSDYYQEKYGVVPEFKAGLHYGHVMAGEIGVVKRDITFSGDVLNTTSRIQEQCNKLGVNILISHLLLDRIKPAIKSYIPKKIGDLTLRGKTQELSLFTF